VTYQCDRIHIPANRPPGEMATVLEFAKPEGGRLVSVVPDGYLGTYLVVWEVTSD
jgi:hypothetical protein